MKILSPFIGLFYFMIELTKGTATEYFYVTLDEKTTLDEPYYLFIFTHTLTKAEVTKIYAPGADFSDYPGRYNKFEILTVTLFLNQPVGEWLYTAYEQTSAVNVDPDLTTGIVEQGKLRLYPAAADVFEQEMYNEATTYKSYQG
jgi:hypothetical protein